VKLKGVGFLAASVGTILVSAATALGQTATEDSVRGAGILATGLGIEVDARSGPSGENPRGTFVATFRGAREEFSIACLHVTGRTAVLGANLLNFDVGALIEVVDGSPDTFGGMPLTVAVQEQDCRTPFVAPSQLPLVSGDLVVTDAEPFPSSKDQCKNGGWKNFPGFKNQGDCVSFVATGGKNPPGS
jgi:hypothetical protein